SRRPIGVAEAIVAALASAGAVALVTGAIAGARPYVPVLSLGVLYVFAVLPVAVAWGLAYAIPVSVASMLSFNFFFLPPTHTFALRDNDGSRGQLARRPGPPAGGRSRAARARGG